VEPPACGESNRWLVLVIVRLAQFMGVLDATVVNVALPSIQAHLGLSAASLQWAINGYTLIFGGFLLFGGRAGDLFGRLQVAFTAAAILVAFGAVLLMLAVARATWRTSIPTRRTSRAPDARSASLQGILQRAGVCAGTTTPPNRRPPGRPNGGTNCGQRWSRGRIAARRRRSARREPVSSPRRRRRRWLGLPHSSSRPRSCSGRCSPAAPRRY